MFEVYLINDEFTIIHSAGMNEIKLTAMELSKEINSVNLFNFSFLPNNPAAALLELNKTRLRVLRLSDRNIIFEGYVNQYNGEIATNNQTLFSYSADDILGVLTHSDQPKFSFKGKVSDFIKKLLDNHNSQVEPWKQFALGVCELDTYIVYPDEETVINQNLNIGDKATIKQSTKYIWNNDNVRLNIASSVLGVTHTVDTVGSGTFEGKYLLRHPNSAWGISGWVQAEDIVEYYAYNEVMTLMSTNQSSNSKIVKVTIRREATSYYVDSYTNAVSSIPSFVKTSTELTINRDLYSNKRYALYRRGVHIAWINEGDILFGGQVIEVPIVDQPDSIEKTRIVEIDVESGSTWDNLFMHIINEIGGEISWRMDEGVYTLDVLKKIGSDSDLMIALEYNLQEISEAIDETDIITKVRAIGKPPNEEGD